MKFFSSLLLLLGLFIASFSYGDNAMTPVVSVVNVKTSNPAAYRAYLKDNPGIFEALGAESGGTCTTVSGHRYPGQAFAFSFYNDASSAFKAATKFSQTPRNAELEAISSVVSAEFYAVLKPFTLPSGFERRYQIVVNDASAYIAAATNLEKAMQENGHKVAGMMVNDFLQRKAWALEPYGKMLATIESLELDTFEDCVQVYTAN